MNRTQSGTAPDKRKRGFLHRLFGRGDMRHSRARMPIREQVRGAHSISVISRASSFAGTGCRWCGISCSRWASRRRRASCSGRFVSGDESDAPQITTAEDWHVGFPPGPGDNLADAPRRKPDYCLNVGITWPGLVALEIKDRVPSLSFKSFGAFIAGAAERAALVGDTGASAPQNWIECFRDGKRSRPDDAARHQPGCDDQRIATGCRALFAEGDAFREIWRTDGMALTEIGMASPSSLPRFTSVTPTASA